MKHNRWCLLAATALMALASLTGCDGVTDGEGDQEAIANRPEKIDLDDPYGGFNTADAPAAFGDPLLMSDYGADFGVATRDDVDTTDCDRRHPRRFLMVTWGNLRGDSLIDYSTDWTGGLCADNGVVRLLRTIRFEPRDRILPRTSRQCIEWESHTQPSFDGVIVALHKFKCDSLSARADSLCEPLSVTFKTGPLTVTFTEKELTDLHTIIPVDDAGNAVAFNVIERRPGVCGNGFLAGQWKPVESDHERLRGFFRGKWISENGMQMGYLRGIYGLNRSGEQVFFGKWVAETGRFRGLLAGHYGVTEENDTGANGWFEGVWFSRQLRSVGGLRGVWRTSDDMEEGGFFRGAWRTRCLR